MFYSKKENKKKKIKVKQTIHTTKVFVHKKHNKQNVLTYFRYILYKTNHAVCAVVVEN